ncbi:MAG TPA: hypothetical protein VFF13_01760 [archaeon]|nr:hypothetical protein [archaeon]
MSKKPQNKKKEKSGSMPTEAQIAKAAKELEQMPEGATIVRNGFKYACTEDGHIVFQKE